MVNHFDRLLELLNEAITAGKRPVAWRIQHGLFVYLLAREPRVYRAAQWKNRRPATLLGLPYEVDDLPIAEDFQLIVREQSGVDAPTIAMLARSTGESCPMQASTPAIEDSE